MTLAENAPVNAGEIYYITIPSKGGREQEGRRPCIVMSRRSINVGNPIVVVPMTSNTKRANSYNIRLPATEILKDISNRSPIVDSVALCGQVFTVDKRKLEDKFGKLSDLALFSVQLGLAYVFDIR